MALAAPERGRFFLVLGCWEAGALRFSPVASTGDKDDVKDICWGDLGANSLALANSEAAIPFFSAVNTDDAASVD